MDHQSVRSLILAKPSALAKGLRKRGPKETLGALRALGLNLDINAGGNWKNFQFVDGVEGRIKEIKNADVRSRLELLARLSVDVRRTEDRIDLSLCWERNRPHNASPCSFRRFDDILNRAVKHPLVKRLKADADFFSG